jgi:hypothetical protein
VTPSAIEAIVVEPRVRGDRHAVLAPGIGVTTAVISLVNALRLQPRSRAGEGLSRFLASGLLDNYFSTLAAVGLTG